MKDKEGFTVIGLVVVVMIIGVIFFFAYPDIFRYFSPNEKSVEIMKGKESYEDAVEIGDLYNERISNELEIIDSGEY